MTEPTAIDWVYPEARDRAWRLNNLYTIVDENGKEVEFTLNVVQAALFSGLHDCNVILKARQLGFTTLVERQLQFQEREGVKGRGIAPNGWLIEHWQSTDGSSFTITITTPKGLTCLVAAGSDWE